MLQNNCRLTFEEWEAQGGQKSFLEEICSLNKQRKREGKDDLKYSE